MRQAKALSGFVVAAVYAVLTSPALADWPVNGRAVCESAGDQIEPAMVPDIHGGAIVTWSDNRSGNYDIYAQRLNAAGDPLWSVDGVVVCGSASDQRSPAIVTDDSDGVIIVWADGRNPPPFGTDIDLYAQRLRPDGTPIWAANGLPIKTYPGDQSFPVAVADGYGGAVVAWQDSLSSNWEIYAQRISPLGVIGWGSNIGTPVCTAQGDQKTPQLTADNAGGFIVAWNDIRAGDDYSDIYAQRMALNGSRQWAENGIAVAAEVDKQSSPRVTADDLGALITWLDRRSGGERHVYAQRVSHAGDPLWALNGVRVSPGVDVANAHVPVCDGAGEAIIAYGDFRVVPSVLAGAYARRLDASGHLSNETTIWNSGGGAGSITAISDGQRGAVVAWIDGRRGEGAADLYAQRLDGAGHLDWIYTGVNLCTAASERRLPFLVADGLGGGIVAWQDKRSGNWDIYAQVINQDGQVGAYWAAPGVPLGLLATMNNSRSITLTWDPTDNIVEYRVYRGTSEALLSLITTVPSGTTQYVDEQDLAEGTPYYYKIQSVNPRGESALSIASSATTNQPPSGEVVAATGAIGSDCVLSFNVTDRDQPEAVGVKSFHRRGGTTAFVKSSATFVAGTWQSTVPGSLVTAHGLQYYAMAFDGIDSTRIPATGFASVEIAVSEQAAFQVVAASTVEGYAMYGLPYIAPDTRPTMIFDELGAYDAESWRYFTWNPTDGAYREYPNAAEVLPGSGFWLISATSANIAASGTTASLGHDFQITLQPGWNQISNPFAFDVPFSALVLPEGTDATIYRYNGQPDQRYDVLPLSSDPALEPYRGYWIRHDGASSAVLRVPPVGTGGTAARATDPQPWAIGTSEAGWSVSVRVNAAGVGDGGYRFGLQERASDDRDVCDIYAPPAAPGGFAYLGFLNGDEQRLWSDFRSADLPGATWTLRMDSDQAGHPFQITFTPEQALPAGWQLRAIDLATLREVDLLTEGQLNGRIGTAPFSRTWRVVGGPTEYQDRVRQDEEEQLAASIVEFALRPTTPNPQTKGGGSIVTLAAPHAAEGSLCVYDLRGRLVVRLYEGTIARGLTQYPWDGCDRHGRAAAAGVYLVRLHGTGVEATAKLTVLR